MTPSYYDLLAVSPSASVDVIDAAYKTNVEAYRAGGGSVGASASVTELLDRAWHTLSDPTRRAEYDASLTGTSLPELIACDVCGKIDARVRSTKFVYVWSIVVFTSRSSKTQRYCRPCRSAAVVKNSLTTGLLGWWGFPFGLIYTPWALVGALGGGIMDRHTNGLLLRDQGYAYWHRNDLANAATALTDSIAFEPSAEVATSLRTIAAAGGVPAKSAGMLRGQWIALAMLTSPAWIACVLLAILVGFAAVTPRDATAEAVGDCTTSVLLDEGKDAVAACTKAIGLDRKSVTAYRSRCKAYASVHNMPAAIKDCKSALALDPQDRGTIEELAKLGASPP